MFIHKHLNNQCFFPSFTHTHTHSLCPSLSQTQDKPRGSAIMDSSTGSLLIRAGGTGSCVSHDAHAMQGACVSAKPGMARLLDGSCAVSAEAAIVRDFWVALAVCHTVVSLGVCVFVCNLPFSLFLSSFYLSLYIYLHFCSVSLFSLYIYIPVIYMLPALRARDLWKTLS